ncbi:MAG: hypothetical protein CL609_20065 [Anaerolineaceae bacterium]|nr:hypothetical protein [Anaerolineaceae bacterium]
MKKWILVNLIFIFLLSSCQGLSFPRAQNDENAALSKTEPTTGESSSLTAQPTATRDPLGERFRIKNYYLNAPKDWFFTVVNEERMLGWVFTPTDPQLMADQGLKDWSAILWLVTPLPSGVNAEQMRAQMFENIDAYGDDELQAALLPAQQTGIIELLDEPVLLVDAEIVQWGGLETIHLEGDILFDVDGVVEQVDVSVYLTWNAEEFISFYQFSDQSLTDSLTPAFLSSRESLKVP